MATAGTWSKILEVLKPQVPTGSYETWFRPTRQAATDNGHLKIRVPSREFANHIHEKWGELICRTAASLNLGDFEIEFEFDEPAPAVAVEEPEPEPQEPEEKTQECPTVPAICWRGDAAIYRDLVGPCIESSDNYQLAGFLTMLFIVLAPPFRAKSLNFQFQICWFGIKEAADLKSRGLRYLTPTVSASGPAKFRRGRRRRPRHSPAKMQILQAPGAVPESLGAVWSTDPVPVKQSAGSTDH